MNWGSSLQCQYVLLVTWLIIKHICVANLTRSMYDDVQTTGKHKLTSHLQSFSSVHTGGLSLLANITLIIKQMRQHNTLKFVI